MSKDQECDTRKEFDIVSGISIDTQYPVERFLFKWKISNYSKIFNNVEVHFSTTAKSTQWRLKFRGKKGPSHRIELWQDYDTEVRVEYQALTKTLHKILQNEGTFEFKRGFNNCMILTIPDYVVSTNGDSQKVQFENDVLDFQCTLIILGHTITRNIPLLDLADFSSKQINFDLENLFQTKEHCDIMVSDGKSKISAHKAILCARSPVFNIMFQQDMLENKNNEVVIDDIDFETLHDFLSFLYSGKVEKLSFNSAMSLYYAADKYEVQDLRVLCSEFLLMH